MDSNYILIPNGDLYHWGIKGQKWGIRRYQTKDGSLTPAGKKRYDKDMAKIKAETKKLKAQQRTDKKLSKLEEAKKNLQTLKDNKKNKEAAEEVAKKVEDDNTKRERILREPNAKEVLENRHLFSDKEITSIRMRLQEENTIKSLVPAEVDKGKQFVDNAVDNLNRVSSVIESGSKAWNGIAKVYNSLWGKKNGIELPLINEKTKSKADKIKEEAELLEAKNRLKKAQDEGKEKEKSDYDKLKEEVERREMENRLKKAENNRLDTELDKRGIEKRAKEMDAKEAEQARKENEARSQREYDAANNSYRKTSGERTTVSPNQKHELTVYNRNTTSRGKNYVDNATNSNAISPSLASKIRTMAASSNKTYSEIAKDLGVSTSTVQNYSRGRDTTYTLLDKNGSTIIGWNGDDD